MQGALLVLQSHATAETIFESADLKRHMVRQHEHWCAFVRDTVRVDVRPEEIVLVSGWAKSSADWAAAVFSNTSTRHEASLQAQIGRFVGLELFHSRARTLSGPRVPRQGSKYPRRADTDEVLSQDQCMFVKRYRLKKRLGVLHHIVAGAGYDEPPVDREGGHDEGGAVTDETEPRLLVARGSIGGSSRLRLGGAPSSPVPAYSMLMAPPGMRRQVRHRPRRGYREYHRCTSSGLIGGSAKVSAPSRSRRRL